AVRQPPRFPLYIAVLFQRHGVPLPRRRVLSPHSVLGDQGRSWARVHPYVLGTSSRRLFPISLGGKEYKWGSSGGREALQSLTMRCPTSSYTHGGRAYGTRSISIKRTTISVCPMSAYECPWPSLSRPTGAARPSAGGRVRRRWPPD